MSVSPIIPAVTGSAGVPSLDALTGVNVSGPATAPGPVDSSFGQVLAGQVDQLQALNNTSDKLAMQAATGTLRDVHDYMIAATQTQLSTDMAVALRDKGVDAFNEIMKMNV